MKPIIALTTEAVTLKRPHGYGSFCGVAYSTAVAAAGGLPLLLPLTADPALLDEYLGRCHGLLLTGGSDVSARFYAPDLPAAEREKIEDADETRDAMEIHLARAAAAADRPVLGICRGIQLLNVAFGGTLMPDIAFRRPEALAHRHRQPGALTHALEWTAAAQQLGFLAPLCPVVNSNHHQALDRVAPVLQVVARARDGIVEAVEKPAARFFCAVQFHPERQQEIGPQSARLFAALVAAAAESGK